MNQQIMRRLDKLDELVDRRIGHIEAELSSFERARRVAFLLAMNRMGRANDEQRGVAERIARAFARQMKIAPQQLNGVA